MQFQLNIARAEKKYFKNIFELKCGNLFNSFRCNCIYNNKNTKTIILINFQWSLNELNVFLKIY